MPEIQGVVNSIQAIIIGIAGTVFVICIVVAGLMRMLSFGNERRIAVSNMALTAAVVGLIVILAALVLQSWLVGLFPNNPGVPNPIPPPVKK